MMIMQKERANSSAPAKLKEWIVYRENKTERNEEITAQNDWLSESEWEREQEKRKQKHIKYNDGS